MAFLQSKLEFFVFDAHIKTDLFPLFDPKIPITFSWFFLISSHSDFNSSAEVSWDKYVITLIPFMDIEFLSKSLAISLDFNFSRLLILIFSSLLSFLILSISSGIWLIEDPRRLEDL